MDRERRGIADPAAHRLGKAEPENDPGIDATRKAAVRAVGPGGGGRRKRTPDKRYAMSTLHEDIPPLEPIYRKVEADSRFSLHYLKTVDAAIAVTVNLRNDAETAEKVIERIVARIVDSGGFSKPIDPENTLSSLAASAEGVVKEAISAVRDLADALDGPTFPGEDTQEMSKAGEEAIGALRSLHDRMVDLRWAVLEHDADLETPDGKAYDDVEELVADLRRLS